MNKKSMFFLGLALFSLISFIFISKDQRVQADHNPTHTLTEQSYLVKLNSLMRELYDWSKDNNKMAAYNQLQTIKLHINTHQTSFTAQFEQFQLFVNELTLLESQLTANETQLWKETTTRLFLASDAMVQGDAGPWREYEVLMLDRIRLMESSFINPSTYRASTMQANLSTLQEQLNRVTLATQLVGNKTRLDELQFRVLDMQTFMMTLPDEAEQVNYYKELEQSISGIKQTTLALFGTTSLVSIEPVMMQDKFPIQVALILAMLVFAVLTMTSYRKYKQAPYGVKRL